MFKFRQDLYYRLLGLPIELPPLRQRGNDIILLAKNVDGVYNKDPKEYADAVKYDTLTFTQVLNDQLNVMDMTAATMCRDNKLPILVFDMAEGNFVKAINGEKIGTLVTE